MPFSQSEPKNPPREGHSPRRWRMGLGGHVLKIVAQGTWIFRGTAIPPAGSRWEPSTTTSARSKRAPVGHRDCKQTTGSPRPKRQSRSLRHCPHASCTYSTDQGAVRLATHVRTHLHDRPHQCEQCGKPFKTTEHLRQHARTHIELRLFTCDRPVCKHTDHPAFKTSIELALHAKRTHTLDKYVFLAFPNPDTYVYRPSLTVYCPGRGH